MHVKTDGSTEDITGNLTALNAVRAIAVEPFNPRTLYAGTDIGFYRTTDGGVTWDPFQNGMPVVEITTLKWIFDDQHDGSDFLAASTYGRGMWTRNVPGGPVVFVDGSVAASGTGSFESPMKTVAEGVAIAPNGAVVAVKANTYVEPQVIDKNVTIVSWAGTAVIK